MNRILAYGKANINVLKPSFAFPVHLMFTLFVAGYTCEYMALGSTFFSFVISAVFC
jgi:hypothetical protein